MGDIQTHGKLTLTIDEAAGELRCSRRHIYRMLKKRILRGVAGSLNRRTRQKNWRILRQSIMDFVYDPRRAS
jgi:excisionase family DNA binding protein